MPRARPNDIPLLELEPVYRRFLRFVRRQRDGCWLWTGCTSQKAYHRYPEFWFEYRMQGAHRVAYRLWKGTIRRKWEVHHTCENPLCVNPKHLQAMPKRRNGALANAKRRAALAAVGADEPDTWEPW